MSVPDAPVGLPSLPGEILLEIISYLHDPGSQLEGYVIHLSPAASEQRQAAVKSLMETCRTLRSFFLPYYWQRIELSGVLDQAGVALLGQRNQSELAMSTLRRLRTVTEYNPDLAIYVQSIHINLLQPKLEQVTAELIRCMGVCPNLHTIQLADGFFGTLKRLNFADAFKGKQFPAIHTASVGPGTLPVTSSLPNLRHLYWHSRFDRDHEELSAKLRELQLESFYGLTPKMVLDHVESGLGLETIFPNIRTIQLDLTREAWHDNQDGKHEKVLTPLSRLPNLVSLHLRLPDIAAPRMIRPLHTAQAVDYVDFAKRLLSRKSVSGEERSLTVVKPGAPPKVMRC